MHQTAGETNGWFTEVGVLNSKEVTISMKINQVIEQRKSEFQNILVFQK